MNKTYLTIAGVAIVALVGFGIVTQEQGDNAETLLSNLNETTSTFTSDVAASVESTTTNVIEGVEELASDVQATTTETYEAAVNEVLEAGETIETAIEPAAGEAEATADEVLNAIEDTTTEIESDLQN